LPVRKERDLGPGPRGESRGFRRPDGGSRGRRSAGAFFKTPPPGGPSGNRTLPISVGVPVPEGDLSVSPRGELRGPEGLAACPRLPRGLKSRPEPPLGELRDPPACPGVIKYPPAKRCSRTPGRPPRHLPCLSLKSVAGSRQGTSGSPARGSPSPVVARASGPLASCSSPTRRDLTTLSGGSLGSCVDEERSQVR